MQRSFLVVIIMFFVSVPAYAGYFTITNTDLPSRTLKAYLKDSGEFLWESRVKGETVSIEGRSYVRIREQGKGIWDNKEKRVWDSEVLYLYENDRIFPKWSKLIFYDTKGVTVDSLSVEYKPSRGKIYSRSLRNGDKEFDYKDGIIEKSCFGLVFANLDYEKIKEMYVPMLTNEPAYYGMTFVNKGVEVVTQEGQTNECYKVQMIPDLGMLGFVGAFVPKTYFWYTAKYPHKFIRYEGLESGLGTPYVVMMGSEK